MTVSVGLGNASKQQQVANLTMVLQAQKEGKGAVALDGKLIDNASIKQAQVLVQMAERAGMKQ